MSKSNYIHVYIQLSIVLSMLEYIVPQFGEVYVKKKFNCKQNFPDINYKESLSKLSPLPFTSRSDLADLTLLFRGFNVS